MFPFFSGNFCRMVAESAPSLPAFLKVLPKLWTKRWPPMARCFRHPTSTPATCSAPRFTTWTVSNLHYFSCVSAAAVILPSILGPSLNSRLNGVIKASQRIFWLLRRNSVAFDSTARP